MARRKPPVAVPPEPGFEDAEARTRLPARRNRAERPASVDVASPQGLTVNAECMHTSGLQAVAQCIMDGAPVGESIYGIWVSAGALKYATPTTAAVKRAGGGRQVGHLTKGRREARIALPLGPDADAILFDLDESITLAKGDVLTVRWENKSGKRCGHYVACATKG